MDGPEREPTQADDLLTKLAAAEAEARQLLEQRQRDRREAELGQAKRRMAEMQAEFETERERATALDARRADLEGELDTERERTAAFEAQRADLEGEPQRRVAKAEHVAKRTWAWAERAVQQEKDAAAELEQSLASERERTGALDSLRAELEGELQSERDRVGELQLTAAELKDRLGESERAADDLQQSWDAEQARRQELENGLAQRERELDEQSQRLVEEACAEGDARLAAHEQVITELEHSLAGEGESAAALEAMRNHPLGTEAARIGRVTPEHPGIVVARTPIGGKRILDLPFGESLPRIC